MSTALQAEPLPNAERRPVGVLLINLGTPDSTDVGDVRRYLREFLSDPRVVDINPIGRWMLLNFVILPFRPRKSAEAYRSIWTDEGSPLLVYEQELADKVQAELGPHFHVELAMRYGNPSIPDAVNRLMAMDPERIVIVPLFPQYSSAATGSALDRALEVIAKQWNVPTVETVPAFFDDPGFIGSFADVARPLLRDFAPDHVVFSYHGVPERQVTKSDPTGAHCLASSDCCSVDVKANRYCYRAQCYRTTEHLIDALRLDEAQTSTTFQSRLGRTPWIRPYTDEFLTDLAKSGVKRVAVLCPAFVADCLETLEEIGMRAAEDWQKDGGEELLMVPSRNAHPRWVETIANWVRDRSHAVRAAR